MSVLVIAELHQGQLSKGTLSAVTAAREVDDKLSICVIGSDTGSAAKEAALITGVVEVITVNHPVYEFQLAENAAKVIASIAETYSHVIAASSAFSKNIMPRVAALLGVGQLSEVVRIIDKRTVVRPIYAGNALQTVESLDKIMVMTIRQTAFIPAEKSNQSAPIKSLDVIIENNQTQFVEQSLSQQTRPELTQARVIISGGRGLQSAENFKLLEALADELGGAIGASRAAVDAGMVPNDYQVGQTGKVVAPELYIAVGISGAVQHIAGMKDSKIIVAINKDPDAPIFSVADFGLVGDLFEIIPELTKLVAAQKGK